MNKAIYINDFQEIKALEISAIKEALNQYDEIIVIVSTDLVNEYSYPLSYRLNRLNFVLKKLNMKDKLKIVPSEVKLNIVEIANNYSIDTIIKEMINDKKSRDDIAWQNHIHDIDEQKTVHFISPLIEEGFKKELSQILESYKTEKKGKLVLFSGPSGVGKGTIRDILVEDPILNIAFSVSATTRLPRQGEKNGVEYFFKSREEFEDMIKDDRLLEWAEFADNYYGTPNAEIHQLLLKGKNVLLEIEIEGAKQIIEKLGKENLITIFILPPSLQELEKRLVNRSTESREVIEKRLKRGEKEIEESKDVYQYKVLNIVPIKAAKQIKKIILNA